MHTVQQLQDLSVEFLSEETTHQRRSEIIHSLDHSQYLRWLAVLEKSTKQKNIKYYQYMVTFTLDPSKVADPISQEREDKIDDLVKCQGTRPGLKIVHYSYVKEYHKNGRPHWHSCVVTSVPLKLDRFINFTNRYGTVKIDKSKLLDFKKNWAQQIGDIQNYLSKYGDPIKVI